MAQARVSKDDFEKALTTATEQHFRSYTQSFALHVRWEDDNTEAERDCRNFQSFLHSVGFGTPEVLELSRDDTTPGWTAVSKFAEILNAANKAASNGRCIIFFHYAGHGIQGHNDTLLFTSASGLKSFNAGRLFSDVDSDSVILDDNSPVDVVFILDCCYSFLATKAAKPVGRIVEILAAVDANTPGAFIPGQRVSFTAKLATKAASLKGQGYQSIELAEIMSFIRAELPIKKPSHTVRIGNSSVRYGFLGRCQTKLLKVLQHSGPFLVFM